MRKLRFTILILFFCASAVLAASDKDPVQYGGDENLDACPTLAQVTNLSEGKDEFLAVKAAPHLKATRLDKLHRGQSLWICQEKKDWYGVVYSTGQNQNCGVTQAVKTKKVYDGPCKSGWVSKKFVELVAD
jgi:hypothetical protein